MDHLECGGIKLDKTPPTEWGWDDLIGREGDDTLSYCVPLEIYKKNSTATSISKLQRFTREVSRSQRKTASWMYDTSAPLHGSAERLINSPHFINLRMPPLIKRAVIVSRSIMHMHPSFWRSSTRQRKSDHEIIITFLSVTDAKPPMVEKILSPKKTYVSVFFCFPSLSPLIEVKVCTKTMEIWQLNRRSAEHDAVFLSPFILGSCFSQAWWKRKNQHWNWP